MEVMDVKDLPEGRAVMMMMVMMNDPSESSEKLKLNLGPTSL